MSNPENTEDIFAMQIHIIFLSSQFFLPWEFLDNFTALITSSKKLFLLKLFTTSWLQYLKVITTLQFGQHQNIVFGFTMKSEHFLEIHNSCKYNSTKLNQELDLWTVTVNRWIFV